MDLTPQSVSRRWLTLYGAVDTMLGSTFAAGRSVKYAPARRWENLDFFATTSEVDAGEGQKAQFFELFLSAELVPAGIGPIRGEPKPRETQKGEIYG